MDIKNVKVSEIHPYSKNAKKHDKKQVKNVAESIRQFGFVQPLVLDSNNEIVIGHCRWEAAKLLKLDGVPCVYVDGLSDNDIKALRLADNKLNESAWDISLLTQELEGLDFGNIEIDWDLDSVSDKAVEDNYEPAPPENPKAKLGDIYQLGRHRLMCGDSTQLSDVEKLMDGKLADMLLTDPPYGVSLGTGGVYKVMEAYGIDMGGHDAANEDGSFLLNDNLKGDDFVQFLTDAFSNAVISMKPGAAFHIWHADVQRMAFDEACHNAGLIIRQCLIWVKDRFTLSRQDFQWQHEPCLYGERFMDEDPGDEHETALYGWKSGAGHYWFKNRKQSTVLFFDRPTVSKEHPTMKPITLFDYEMKCNSLVDDIVLDLFAGSGTTIMAAEQNGRIAYCMEYDPKFVDVIIDRWQTWTGEEAVLLN